MGHYRKSIGKGGALLAIAAMWAAAAYGQGTTATISGNVTDSSGASVAGAKVIATNLGTNLASGAAKSLVFGLGPSFDLYNYGYMYGAGGNNNNNPLLTINWHSGTAPEQAGAGHEDRKSVV